MSFLRHQLVNFFPNEILDNVTIMTPEWLKNRGIKGIISDLDNTLAETDECPDHRVISWKEDVKKAVIKTVLVTHNHRHAKLEDILNHLHLTFNDIVFSWPYFRPFQRSIKEAIAKFGPDIKAHEILVVDDFIFGIWPANKLGCYTVLVKPISRLSEWNHLLLLCARFLEYILIKHLGIDFPD